ncbi:MAG TPA: CPBP family intramembrane glutamic endopeptidase [Acidobacteriaceae bacterium]|nr:CPBP family intramembrane glutamic endopeptidase [Acidobacteriaceae bacterium]
MPYSRSVAFPGQNQAAASEPPLDMFGIPTQAPEPRQYPHRIPHIGHVVLFFVIAFVFVVVGQLLGVFLLFVSHILPHRTYEQLYVLSSNDARISIPIQALSYGLVALVCIPIFTVIWNESFGEGVRWHAGTARRRFLLLLGIGLAVGFSVTFLGDYLPMPKNPPITQDMMKSAAGAWIMLVFGLTVAPMLEELAFRGFLLPGLINSFRWFGDRGMISPSVADRVGIPFSILLTSLAFAYMHSPQVSHAWGPLLLIGIVSVVLCIVRLAMNSVAAGVIVHSAYNFTLFIGVLYQTNGFQHLDKLK